MDRFAPGSLVRVISGLHSGRTGCVRAVASPRFRIVFFDATSADCLLAVPDLISPSEIKERGLVSVLETVSYEETVQALKKSLSEAR